MRCAVLLLICGLSAGCGREPESAPVVQDEVMSPAAVADLDRPADPDAHPYSLIWISLDTLRADHLGIYGYDRDTSPFLDEIARRGLYFEWAVTPQNVTLPVHVTMFTGFHPTVHQIMFSRKVIPGVRIASSVVTLPKILHDAGFATRAWTDGGKMTAIHGFSMGFDVYEDEPQYLPHKLDEALAYIDGLDPGRRYFCFIHTYQVHHPYPAPEPTYSTRFATDGPCSEAQHKMDLYDGCIRFVDDSLRDFIGELEQRGALDSTIVMITGDHGESFAEHGVDHIGHASHLLNENITRVPWIMLHPDAAYRGRIGELVGLIDFPNTVLGLLGFDERLAGGGVNVLAPGRAGPREYVSWTPESMSLYSGDLHLVISDKYANRESNALYRFRTDQRETTPLDDPEAMSAMRARLAELHAALQTQSSRYTASLREFGEPPGATDKLWQQLRALGYVK